MEGVLGLVAGAGLEVADAHLSTRRLWYVKPAPGSVKVIWWLRWPSSKGPGEIVAGVGDVEVVGEGIGNLALGAFGALTALLLPDHKDLYVEILKILVVFAGGAGSGWGLKSYLDQRRR